MSNTYNGWVQARDSGPRTLYERRSHAPSKIATRAAFLAGFIVAWTPIFAPVHEMGHVLTGWLDPGITVKEMTWTDTWFLGDASVLFLLGGFTFASIVYTAVSVLLARRGKLIAASFFAGNVLSQPIYAARSTDIYTIEILHGVMFRQGAMAVIWIASMWCLLFALAHITNASEHMGEGKKLAERVNMIPDPPGKRR